MLWLKQPSCLGHGSPLSLRAVPNALSDPPVLKSARQESHQRAAQAVPALHTLLQLGGKTKQNAKSQTNQPPKIPNGQPNKANQPKTPTPHPTFPAVSQGHLQSSPGICSLFVEHSTRWKTDLLRKTSKGWAQEQRNHPHHANRQLRYRALSELMQESWPWEQSPSLLLWTAKPSSQLQ